MNENSDSVADEYRAACEGTVLRDASHWGRLYIRGTDHLDFLHRMTTNDFNSLEIGQGREAVFIEQRARIIDLGVFYRGINHTLLLVSPQSRSEVPAWLDRFIFAEAIEFEDVTKKTAMLECFGPQSVALLRETLSLDLSLCPAGDLIRPHETDELWLARTDWDGNPGLRAIGAPEAIAEMHEQLQTAGATPIGETTWEILRIEQGIPLLGRELSDAYNPWEAGLERAIHMNKGCYIGQEVVARLDTYDKIKQHLVGLRLPVGKLPLPGQSLSNGKREVGRITSVIESPEHGAIALAYAHRTACGEGTELQYDTQRATVVSLPFSPST